MPRFFLIGTTLLLALVLAPLYPATARADLPEGCYWAVGPVVWCNNKTVSKIVQADVRQPCSGQTMWASWYHEGSRTATGERYQPDGMTAAHRTLPFGTKLRVSRGKTSVVVRVNDRGPARWTGRVLDLSRGAARSLAMLGAGVAPVCVERL